MGTWGREPGGNSEAGALLRPDSWSPGLSLRLETALQGACQAVRGLPGVQGQWDPGVGMGKSYGLGYTWDPADPFPGREES